MLLICVNFARDRAAGGGERDAVVAGGAQDEASDAQARRSLPLTRGGGRSTAAPASVTRYWGSSTLSMT